MSANLEQSRNQPAWPTPRGDPSRRHLLIGLPAVAVAGGGLRPAPQRQPDGEEAAHLAVKVRTAGWGRPSGFCEALHKAWRRDVLTSLLVSYAAIHGARLRTRPSVLHMLAFSDTIMRAPHWIEPQALWDAFRLYEFRDVVVSSNQTRGKGRPRWTGAEDIADKTIFVFWEQGLGDTIQFCRYLPRLSALGARVVASVQEPLHRLLAQFGSGVEIIGEDETPGAFDYAAPLLSLPLAFGET